MKELLLLTVRHDLFVILQGRSWDQDDLSFERVTAELFHLLHEFVAKSNFIQLIDQVLYLCVYQLLAEVIPFGQFRGIFWAHQVPSVRDSVRIYLGDDVGVHVEHFTNAFGRDVTTDTSIYKVVGAVELFREIVLKLTFLVFHIDLLLRKDVWYGTASYTSRP